MGMLNPRAGGDVYDLPSFYVNLERQMVGIVSKWLADLLEWSNSLVPSVFLESIK